MRTRFVTRLVMLLWCVAFPISAELYVLPVVVNPTFGLAGSIWESEVRIIRLDPHAPFVVRRAWVALPGGGLVDDPATAPRWEPPAPGTSERAEWRILHLVSNALLAGVEAKQAAVALEIEGPAVAFVRIANTEGKTPSFGPGAAPPLPGNGQLARAAREMLHGPSFIPWITSSTEGGAAVLKFRTSLGFVNPSASPMRLHVTIIGTQGSGGYWWSEEGLAFEPPFTVDLPPWGWTQLNDVFQNLQVCPPTQWWCELPDVPLPSYVRIEPEGDGPYLAYASSIYSPTNDPEFIWAEPGDLGGQP